MYHIIYIMTTPWVSQHCLFSCTCMQYAEPVWKNVFIQRLYCS